MTTVQPSTTASTATPDPRDQRDEADDNAAYLPALTRECERRGLALQLTDDPNIDLPEIRTIDGRLTCIARADQLGIALDEVRLTFRQAAVFIVNRLEDEAVKTADPAQTLGNILDALPEAMPDVFKKTGTAPDLAEALQPEVAERVAAMRDLYHARATAGEAYTEILDVMLRAIRDGADPADVCERVLQLMGQVRSERAGAPA